MCHSSVTLPAIIIKFVFILLVLFFYFNIHNLTQHHCFMSAIKSNAILVLLYSAKTRQQASYRIASHHHAGEERSYCISAIHE